jgi:hypothetical protein
MAQRHALAQWCRAAGRSKFFSWPVDAGSVLPPNPARMRAYWAVWMAASCLSLSALSARAQQPDAERVVLLQSQSAVARPALEASLRIQLRGLELTTLSVDFPPDLPSRVRLASEVAREHSADWVFWADDFHTETDASSSQAVLYVVGRRDGRALIEVVRVPGGQGPEVDRSLALKVRELIGVRDGAALALGVREAEPSGSANRIGLWVELGAQASSEGSAGLAADAFLAIGPSLTTPSLVLAVPLELSYGLPRNVARAGDRIEWTELSAGGWLKLLLQVHPRLQLGGGLGGKLSFTSAEGRSAAGRRGDSTEALAALLVSAEAELRISPAVGARAALGVEQRAQRQRFYIEGREIADTGRTVPYARVSLVWHAW